MNKVKIKKKKKTHYLFGHCLVHHLTSFIKDDEQGDK